MQNICASLFLALYLLSLSQSCRLLQFELLLGNPLWCLYKGKQCGVSHSERLSGAAAYRAPPCSLTTSNNTLAAPPHDLPWQPIHNPYICASFRLYGITVPPWKNELFYSSLLLICPHLIFTAASLLVYIMWGFGIFKGLLTKGGTGIPWSSKKAKWDHIDKYSCTNSRLGVGVAHMLAQSSHIKMFGHLLLNQLPIFHICHDPHTLLLPVFFFYQIIFFLPIFGVCAEFCIVLPFSLDTVFSSLAGFRFELNQISLRPDKDTVSPHVRWKEVEDVCLCVCAS